MKYAKTHSKQPAIKRINQEILQTNIYKNHAEIIFLNFSCFVELHNDNLGFGQRRKLYGPMGAKSRWILVCV